MTAINRNAIILDPWSKASYKREMGPAARLRSGTWIGELDRRRLQAYMIYRLYMSNMARELLATDVTEDRADHREYGDAEMLVVTVASAVLGETQKVDVPDAEDSQGPEHDLQVWLERWMKDEGAHLKLADLEHDSVGLGDGVCYLGWSNKKGRPVMRVCDPGFYFPVLEDDYDEYPSRVHLAWEEDPLTSREARVKGGRILRRITWQLVPLQPRQETNDEAKERLGLGRFAIVLPRDREVIVPDGWEQDEDGRWRTRYPWTPEDEWSYETCVLSDGVFTGGGVTKWGPDDFDETKAEWREDDDGVIFRRDLGIDFIPVIHVPNTPTKEHFGESTLGGVLQVIDDLAANDTDLQRASATASGPVISLSGASIAADQVEYRPGQVWQVGDGRMDVMSTADALDPLLALGDAMASRMSRNSSVSESLIGRIKPSEVPSGIALALGFAPMTTMVRRLRLTRDRKYALLLRFAWKIAAGAGEDVPEWVEDTSLKLGSYLPIDSLSISNMLRELLAVDGVSRFTAVKMLQSIGFPIEDASVEVDAIMDEIQRKADAERGPLPDFGDPTPPGVDDDEDDPAAPLLGEDDDPLDGRE